MSVEIVHGVLHQQPVEAIVAPTSCSPGATPLDEFAAAIAAAAGPAPFQSLAGTRLAPGEARVTHAGVLQYKGIIHVADRDEAGRSSEKLLEQAVRNVLAAVERDNFWSVALPVLALGPEALSECDALARMLLTIYEMKFMGSIIVVRRT
jgi:O-acetyl-ADP-ribose deacetylase (regulator of RNase III)